MAADLVDVEAESDAVGDRDRLRGESGEDERTERAEDRRGLGAGGAHAGEVEGDVEAAPGGRLPHRLREARGERVEGDVRAEEEGSLAGRRQRVDRDDRGRADQPGEPYGVGAEAARAPDADRLGGADRAGAHDRGVRRGDRVGDDRSLVERQLVRDGQ